MPADKKVEDFTLDDVFLLLRDAIQGVPLSDALEGIDIVEVEDADNDGLVVTVSDEDGATRSFDIDEYGVTLNEVDS